MTCNFEKYAAAGFLEHLLPIMPPDAELDPSSPSRKALLSKRGKVPGRKTSKGWTGMAAWPTHVADEANIARWATWNCGVGLQAHSFPALDIDVNDAELADSIHELAVQLLGEAPCRFGRGQRRILVFAGEGFTKRRLAFRRAAITPAPNSSQAESCVKPGSRLAGNLESTDPSQEPPEAVELLAQGQQYVLEGVHPKTGNPYRWSDGCSPAEWGLEQLSALSREALDNFFAQLVGLLELHGYEVVEASAAASRGANAVNQEGLLAPSVGAVGRALDAIPNEVDYDTWIKAGAAIKASCGPDHEADGYELWAAWSDQWEQNTPEEIDAKWASFRAPFSVGWDYLAGLAREASNGRFSGAAEEFDAIEGAEPPAEGELTGPILPSTLRELFARWVWVEQLQRVCDLREGKILNKEQFNVRNSHVGKPYSVKHSAWAQVLQDGRNLQAVDGVTYRPGGPLFVEEDLPGMKGRCVNIWRDPAPPLPAQATNRDVERWLEHVALVVPSESEREVLLNWLAWVIQHPDQKPNWALVIGSTVEGLGKDLMLEPVRLALGKGNVCEITAADLASDYSGYLVNTRLLIVGEMELNERRKTMNSLKPLVAAPPYTLRVNEKYQAQYPIPNLIAAVFFTNNENALAISKGDRRFFVTWNDGARRPDAYYAGLVGWYQSGGAALAARWLLNRDLSGFDAKGRAPDTDAKWAMSAAARSALEVAILDGIEGREGPFRQTLFTLPEAHEHLRQWFHHGRTPDPRRLSRFLCDGGAMPFENRVSLGRPPQGHKVPLGYDPKQTRLFATPGNEWCLDLERDQLRELFWRERRWDSDELEEAFGPESPASTISKGSAQ